MIDYCRNYQQELKEISPPTPSKQVGCRPPVITEAYRRLARLIINDADANQQIGFCSRIAEIWSQLEAGGFPGATQIETVSPLDSRESQTNPQHPNQTLTFKKVPGYPINIPETLATSRTNRYLLLGLFIGFEVPNNELADDVDRLDPNIPIINKGNTKPFEYYKWSSAEVGRFTILASHCLGGDFRANY